VYKEIVLDVQNLTKIHWHSRDSKKVLMYREIARQILSKYRLGAARANMTNTEQTRHTTEQFITQNVKTL